MSQSIALVPEARSARRCLARSVVQTLGEEPNLEAVTIDRAQQKISVATLGRTDVARLTGRLTEKLQESQNSSAGATCGLLTGQSDCRACDEPLSAAELQNITIKNEGPATTIARVTCPTAPKFWRWRDLPFPKFVQRDVELHDVEEHLGEWKWQLLCAGVPGGKLVCRAGSWGAPA